MENQNLLIYFMVLNFAIFFGIPFYVFRRRLSKQMTKTETRVGTKNALICWVVCLLAVTAVSFVMTLLSGQSFKISFSSSINMLWLVSLIGALIYWARSHFLAGPLLLDCGPHRTSSYFRLTAGLALMMGIWTFVESRSFMGAFSWVTFSAYFFAMSYGRLQLRQNGIWQYWGLLRWENVGSYHWEGESQPTLVVTRKRRIWIPLQGAMFVAPHLKQQFDNILREHVPQIS